MMEGKERRAMSEVSATENESGLASPLESGRGMSDAVVESELEQLEGE
jgi:hypothetical protein